MAIKDYNGSDVTSKLLATQSANGFMSANDKKKVDSSVNPNLLLNSNFSLYERGLDTYNANSGWKYITDRWCMHSTSVSTYKNIYGFAIGCNSNQTFQLSQAVERNLDGKTVTVSFQFATDSGRSIYIKTLTVSESSSVSLQKIDNSFSVGIRHVSEYDCAELLISITNISGVLMWVKLEEGSIRTDYINPDPTIELKKCQRYYYESNVAVNDIYKYSITRYRARIYFPKMRIAPTKYKLSVGTYNNIGDGTGNCTISDEEIYQSLYIFNYTFNNEISANACERWGYIGVDAEIYLH